MNERNYRTDDEVGYALQLAGGEVTEAARSLGISRQALHQRLSSKPYLRPVPTEEENLERIERLRKRGRLWDSAKLPWRDAPVKQAFSESEIKEVIRFLKGDLEKYRLARLLYGTPGPHEIGRWRQDVAHAVSLTLKIDPRHVWPKLKSGWMWLEFCKKFDAERKRRDHVKQARRDKVRIKYKS